MSNELVYLIAGLSIGFSIASITLLALHKTRVDRIESNVRKILREEKK